MRWRVPNTRALIMDSAFVEFFVLVPRFLSFFSELKLALSISFLCFLNEANFFQHEVVPRFLSDKLLETNRQKNIPQLTPNQQFLIARLIWYQDGYEQPSDEDLKRITQVIEIEAFISAN